MHAFGEKALLAPFFNLGPMPFGGDGNTIQQATAFPLDPTANPLAIPSLRMAVDVGNWDDARYSLPGGQSGNPCSTHYDDQLDVWLRGEGIPIAFSKDAVEQAIQNQLVLRPSPETT
jgi:penicillin amidase